MQTNINYSDVNFKTNNSIQVLQIERPKTKYLFRIYLYLRAIECIIAGAYMAMVRKRRTYIKTKLHNCNLSVNKNRSGRSVLQFMPQRNDVARKIAACFYKLLFTASYVISIDYGRLRNRKKTLLCINRAFGILWMRYLIVNKD